MLEYKQIKIATKDNTLVCIDRIKVSKGDFILVVGPSGSGKSTFLNYTAGFIPSHSNLFSIPSFSQISGLRCHGSLCFEGREYEKLSPQDRDIGFIFQKNSIYPHLSVLENIIFPLKCAGMPKQERLQKAREIAEKVKLPDHLLNRKAVSLSGGEQQRLAIAKLLAKKPKIRLLDEPFAHLDPILRSELRSIIYQKSSDSYISFMVSHNWDDLEIANKVILITPMEKNTAFVNTVLIDFNENKKRVSDNLSDLQKQWINSLYTYKDSLVL